MNSEMLSKLVLLFNLIKMIFWRRNNFRLFTNL